MPLEQLRIRLRRIIRPIMARIAAGQLLAQLGVMINPEAGQVKVVLIIF
jgi:hypothetical protein